MLNQLTFLDNLGRKQRSKKNAKLEDFLTELQRLTVVHEQDATGTGSSHYRITMADPSAEDDAPAPAAKGKTEAKKADKSEKKEKE